MEKTKIVRPTIRMDVELNKKLKKKLADKGLSMQDLVIRYLESWVENEN